MRLSTRRRVPGYHQKAYLCKVLLDGVEILDCYTADEEAGKAFCYSGIKTGKVEIIKPNNFKGVD